MSRTLGHKCPSFTGCSDEQKRMDDIERSRTSVAEERRNRGCGGGWFCCILTIICCWLIHFTLGIAFSFGNITPYLTSYLRNSTHDFNLGYTDTLWIAAADGISSCVFMVPAGMMTTCLPTSVYLLFGALSTAAKMFGTYQTIQMSFPLTVVTYGLVGGVPGSILYAAALNIATRWFPSKVGLVSGLILTGYGIGGFAWNQLITWYINPDNLQPDVMSGGDVYYSQPEVLSRVPGCFLLLGALFTGLQVLAAILIRLPPSPVIQAKSIPCNRDETTRLISDSGRAGDVTYPGETLHNNHDTFIDQREVMADDVAFKNQDGGGEDDVRQPEYPPNVLLKSRVFWTLWCLVLVTNLGGSLISNLFKAYGQTFITDDHFLTLVASCSSICNALGRPLWGSLADKVTPRMTAFYATCILACLVATFVSCEVTGRVAFFAWVCAMLFAKSGYFTTIPLLTIGLFGPKYFNANLGLVFSADGVCSLIAALVARDLKDVFGWHGVFFFSCACIFIGILLNLSLDLRCGKTFPKHMCRVLSVRK